MLWLYKNANFWLRSVWKKRGGIYSTKIFEVQQKDLQGALNFLYNFYEETENDVSAAVKKIYEYLQATENYFPLDQYSRLANYLIAARKCINDETFIDKCKNEILSKLDSMILNNDAIHELTYHDGIELWTDEQRNEYATFKQEILHTIKVENIVVLEQISTPDDVQKLVDNICENIERYIGNRKFAGQLDVAGLLRTLPECTPKLIHGLRGAFMELYRSVNISEFLMADKSALISLRDEIVKMIADNYINDKIKILQLQWFAGNLSDIIGRLS